MALMDNTRLKAVVKVLTAFAPWSNPQMDLGGRDKWIYMDVVETVKCALVLNVEGFWAMGWFNSGMLMPQSLDPLGLTRSEGGQVVAGTALNAMMAKLRELSDDTSLSDSDRDLAGERLMQLMTVSGS